MRKIEVSKTSSSGIVMGSALILKTTSYEPEDYDITPEQGEIEIERFRKAIIATQEELHVLAEQSEIFEGHYMLAGDRMLQDAVIEKIQRDGMNVQIALHTTKEEFRAVFDAMDDEYMRERASDVTDVCNRIMRILQGKKEIDLSHIKGQVIIVANDLTPSDTARMDFQHILGFVTQEGGITSHVCIMAKSLGIPALVGARGILEAVQENDELILDAGAGVIYIEPDEETKHHYQKKIFEYQNYQEQLIRIEELEAMTIDGHKVLVCGNAGSLTEVENAIRRNADGIGLFRSEFLYMDNSHFPTEEEQYTIYKAATEICPKELTIRTLDIGGDKNLPYYEFEREENPFLGWRAIRISLELKNVFKAQLRAILRASAFGDVRIMYPMIISLEELEEANAVLECCKQELMEEGVLYNDRIPVGMMIETPASVILIEEFASRVDFFSIGTNDLTQYMLAVDRGNQKIAHMYNSYHPAVLRAIKVIIDAAHKNNIKVGMCGEFAGDVNATKLLLGMGLDEFSMAIGQMAKVKECIRTITLEEAIEYADKVLNSNHILQLYRQ